MKSFWIILSFVFLIHPILPVVEYVVNYDYIANVLCINKEKEASTCNGKCHLGKEIAKDYDNNTKKNKPVKAEFNFGLFFQGLAIFQIDLFEYTFNKTRFKSIRTFTHTAYTQKLLQPPKV